MTLADRLLQARAVLTSHVRVLRRRFRRVMCRHRHEVAAVSSRRPVVGLLCRRCGRRRVVERLGAGWPMVAVAPGAVLVDEEALEHLLMAWQVNAAFSEGVTSW